MKFTKNRIVRALALFMLFSAFIHIILLFVLTLKKGNLNNLNYFDILDLEHFFPNISHGWLSQGLSAVTIIIIFFVMYIFFAKYKTRTKKS